MSEPIPESIPTSADPKSKRPTKRRALTPTSAQASQVTALFAKPECEVYIPSASEVLAKQKPHLAAPPEIVANVQGSSAGAGSGEFHVYKASRRREYERVKMMDDQVAKEKADIEFEVKRDEMKTKDEQKTNKNRRKREKMKMKKDGKKGKDGDVMGNSEGKDDHKDTVDVDTRTKMADELGGNAPVSPPVVEEQGLVIDDDDYL